MLCLIAATAPTAHPAPPSATVDTHDAQRALETRGNVTFRDTPLAEVILILSEQWNVNIIAGSEINGQVNGSFKNESLRSILESILSANGLRYQQIGNSLVVLAASESGGTRSSFVVEVLDAPISTAEEMDELITALKLQMSPDGELVPIVRSGKLTVLDTPERIVAVRALLSQIAPVRAGGGGGPTYVSTTDRNASPEELATPPLTNASSVSAVLELRPQFVMAKDLEQPLTMVVGADNISLVEQENIVVVFGDAVAQRKAQQLMQQLDRPRPQVRITGYIYDVDLGEVEKLGVDWGQRTMSTAVDANGVPRNLGMSGTGLLTPAAVSNPANTLSGVVEETATATAGAAGAAATATGPAGGQFLFRTLSSSFELQALIQALEQTKGSRLLADPHVTVVDRHKASLGIVTEIPVQQLTQTQQGGAIGSTSFKDAGITLDVTPRIASDGTIEMQVEPTFSVLSGFQNGNPIIDTRRASTVVRVNHGQALVIGGLRSKTTVETVKGIPGLMNVKYLGALFRTHDTDVRESEMIVFIMPEIVGYCGGLPREMHAMDVTQQQLSRVQTAVDGAFTPDCNDKHCPQHHERPRIHNGMHDNGLIGSMDMIFIDPASPPYIHSTETVISPAEPFRAVPDNSPKPVINIPVLEQASEQPTLSDSASQPRAATSDSTHSSRRVTFKPASYRR